MSLYIRCFTCEASVPTFASAVDAFCHLKHFSIFCFLFLSFQLYFNVFSLCFYFFLQKHISMFVFFMFLFLSFQFHFNVSIFLLYLFLFKHISVFYFSFYIFSVLNYISLIYLFLFFVHNSFYSIKFENFYFLFYMHFLSTTF